jgi:hypothetical protein
VNDLHQARIDLLKAVQDLPENALRARNPDGWSILHVLEHLYLTERAIAQGIRHALSVSSSDPFPQKPIEAILDRSQKVKSPGSTEPNGLFTSLEHAVTSLGASRAELETLLASVENADALRNHGFRHPFLGMLSIHQWLEVLPLHERRHLAQIEEMKQSFSSDVLPE